MIAELNKSHGLPNGDASCDEHLAGPVLRRVGALYGGGIYVFAGTFAGDPWRSCTGRPLEKLAFNGPPGTLTDDVGTPIQSAKPGGMQPASKPWTTDGPESNLLELEPNFGRCTANYHQGWPKFANSLFMAHENNPPQIGWPLRSMRRANFIPTSRGTPVHNVIEETEYPFRGSVRFTLHPEKAAVSFSAAIAHTCVGRLALHPSVVNGQAWNLQTAGRNICTHRTNMESRRSGLRD